MSDWPLLEQIACYDLPIICSTAGAPLEEIDRVVSFFSNRAKQLALMHCVGEYPAPDEHLHLGQIALLKHRYPKLEIGYSTHERPENTQAVKMAIALGATIFEKHAGIPTENYPLNTYSVTPQQARLWLKSAVEGYSMLGAADRRYETPAAESTALRALERGAFLRKPVEAGEQLLPANLFFAMPNVPGQLVAQDFGKYMRYVAREAISGNGAVLAEAVNAHDTRHQVTEIVHDVKALLKKSKVPVPGECSLELSHHYGIDRFRQFGLTGITIVNRAYCKRLMVVLPGQKHPEQWHEQKDETYHILYGEVTVELDGVQQILGVNKVLTIPRGIHHSFWSRPGAVIEEVSSAYATHDSWYADPAILANHDRKTFVTYWLTA